MCLLMRNASGFSGIPSEILIRDNHSEISQPQKKKKKEKKSYIVTPRNFQFNKSLFNSQ